MTMRCGVGSDQEFTKILERFALVLGDITKVPADAIVNAANRRLLGGGGVDGAIHAAAGHGLYQECLRLDGCEPGDAKITAGHLLHARHVIHTVGPIWTGGSQGEEAILASCYRRSLELAAVHEVRSLAFPSIATGVFSFPLDRAARLAVHEILDFLRHNPLPERVTMVCFDPTTLQAYRQALHDLEVDVRGEPPNYQTRNMKSLVVGGVRIMEAPRPPYFSFHGTPCRGLRFLRDSRLDPAEHPLWGSTTVASWAEAKRIAGETGEVLSVYFNTGYYRPFDARSERIYDRQEVEALGVEDAAESTRGVDLVAILVGSHGPQTRDFLKTMGWTGICFEEGQNLHWAIWHPGCVKTTRVVDNPEEAARMEAFDPEPLPRVVLIPFASPLGSNTLPPQNPSPRIQ
jgi:O-acetyl-ADP-ribose deacetylase (regulator of RNase III)